MGRRELSEIQRLEHDVSQVTLGHAVKSEIIPGLLQMLIRTNDISGTSSGSDTQSRPEKPNRDVIKQSRRSLERRRTRPKKRTATESVLKGDNVLEQAPPATLGYRSPHWLEPEMFADMVLADDEDVAQERIRLIQADGVPDEDILLELLAPTSAELGIRWENDTSDFADVTIGVCRLHRIVRSLHPQHRRELVSSAHGGRVVLAPAPGDQHSFGLLLVGELLFRHGWYTDIEISDRSPHIASMVASDWYEMAGISISCENRIEDATALITEIRRASCNPNIVILAGGPVFATNPDAGKTLNADTIALPGDNIAMLTTPYIPTPPRV